MNKKIYWIPVVLLTTFLFAACEESEAPGKFDNWQERNEACMDSIWEVYRAQKSMSSVPEEEKLYAFVDQYSRKDTIFVKKHVREEVEIRDESPKYTDKFLVHYRGSYLLTGDVFDESYKYDEPGEFDTPRSFTLQNTIAGWIWTLQYMKVGERWTLYIPWRSGYGASGSPDGKVIGYTALKFELQLEEVLGTDVQ